jgi:hypothetical protein
MSGLVEEPGGGTKTLPQITVKGTSNNASRRRLEDLTYFLAKKYACQADFDCSTE